jgi:hypothetical protein
MKHPYKKTPQSIIIYTPQFGRNLKGLVIPSFSQPFQRIIEELKRKNTFHNPPPHLKYGRALDLLLKNAWLAEAVALSNATIPCILDALTLMASVHNKKCVEALKTRVLDF